jgi:excisionase family DNA binding protein
MRRRQSETSDTYSVKEAARRLGVGFRAARRAAEEGAIPAIKIGNRFRIPKARFDRLFGGEAA